MQEINVVTTETFKKDVKQYSKKYRNIYDDISVVIEDLGKGKLHGDVIPNIKMIDNENNVIKVRCANSDTKSGKSGRL